jgi:DNA-binding response OmpR family regulator
LPDFNGFELLKNIKNNISTPVIVISAFNDKQTKLQAFKYGACDYMVKPIDLDELEARIWVHISKNTNINIYKKEDVFFKKQDVIYFNNMPLILTNIEFDILNILIKNKNSIISRDSLCELLSCLSTKRSLDNHIKNIRIKLDKIDKNNKYIQTKYGEGYILNINNHK